MTKDREARGAKGFFVHLAGMAELLFPPDLYCISCGAVIDGSRRYGLCDACIRRFGWVGPAGTRTCARCGKLLPENAPRLFCHDCLTTDHVFDRGYTCASYGLYERILINDYKEKGQTYLCRRIGEIMADRWQLRAADDDPAGADAAVTGTENAAVDFAAFVPSSDAKIRKRGFDQMELIAEQFAKETGIPLLRGFLVKKKDRGSMRSLTAEERRQAVQDVYGTKDPDRLPKGATVLLLDDVYTTGSTVDACARVLREAGAGAVYVLTFAAGGDYRPQGEDTVV